MLLNSLAPGGTETSTVALAEALQELGVDTVIVTMKQAEHELVSVAQRAGISVVRLPNGSPLVQFRALRRLIRAQRPDVVHTALFEADQLGRVAAVGTGVPVISSFVNTPYDAVRLRDPNVRPWKLRTVQAIDSITGHLLVDRFHAVSEGVRTSNARALRLKSGRVAVAERGRDTTALGVRSAERRAAVRASLDLSLDAPVVLSLGRQEHQKAQVDLLAAAAFMLPRLPDLVVLLAGKDGSASPEIHRAVDADPGLQRSVHMLGHRSDVGDLLAAADVLAISSHFEGTAGVALEAMAVGTPIVTTRLQGLVGVLGDERNAVVVDTAHPASLAAGLERVLTDPALSDRLAHQAKLDFLERFTLPVAARRMYDLYESVARRSRAA